jgi:hypothetical protein
MTANHTLTNLALEAASRLFSCCLLSHHDLAGRQPSGKEPPRPLPSKNCPFANLGTSCLEPEPPMRNLPPEPRSTTLLLEIKNTMTGHRDTISRVPRIAVADGAPPPCSPPRLEPEGHLSGPPRERDNRACQSSMSFFSRQVNHHPTPRQEAGDDLSSTRERCRLPVSATTILVTLLPQSTRCRSLPPRPAPSDLRCAPLHSAFTLHRADRQHRSDCLLLLSPSA